MARKLIVEIVADVSHLSRGFRQAGTEATGLERRVGSLRVAFSTLAKSVIVIEAVDKALEGLHETIHAGIEEAEQRAKVDAQVQAALKSTGGVANVTAGHIDELSKSLMNLAGVDDEVVKGGEATLLAFQNIRNYAGKGNDIFDRATKAALDFSVRSGRSMQAASVAVGRALQDPAKAAGSLRRAYVVLTADEKKAIDAAVKHGDTLKAQRLILDDLGKRYGGAAAAAGKTFAGAINIARENLRNLAGDIVQNVEPVVTRLATNFGGFIRELSEAHGLRAKLDVVFTGAEHIGQDLVRFIQKGVEDAAGRLSGIDYRALAQRLSRGIRGAFASIDWPAVARAAASGIRQAARGLSDIAVVLLRGITAAIKRIPWQSLGRYFVDGVAIALAVLVQFLRSVKWGPVLRATVRTLAQVFLTLIKAQTLFFLGAGKEIVRLIGEGLKAGFAALADEGKRLLLEAFLKIVSFASSLPTIPHTHIGGGAFKGLRDSLKAQLAALGNQGAKEATAAGQQVTDAFNRSVSTPKAPGRRREPAGGAAAGPDVLPPAPRATGGTGASTRGLADARAARRNQIFDASIQRLLSREANLPLQKQLGALDRISAVITARIAKTKDITRKLNLEDQLYSIQQQKKSVREQLADQFIAGLQFNVDKAGLTANLNDDIAAWRALIAGLDKRIAAETDAGKRLDLENQKLSAIQGLQQTQAQQRQAIAEAAQKAAEARAAKRTAAQFKALGFGPTGEDIIPSGATLRRQLNRFANAIEGTSLNTTKIRRVIANLRKVLSGALGALGKDVRQKIQEMIDGLLQQLADAKQKAKDQAKAAAEENARREGTGGTGGFGIGGSTYGLLPKPGGGFMPVKGSPVGGVPPAPIPPHSGTPSGGFQPTSYTINGGVNLYGVQNVKELETQLQKRAMARPQTRRGPV